MGKTRIGISGWRYAPWRGVFYPQDLVQRDELAFASREFPTIEINGSFYSLQSPQSWQAWYEAAPKGFVFAVKGPRFITHVLRLRDIERPMANFFASGVLALREKLGPILWQFPPNFQFDEEVFAAFLRLLPKSMKAAAALGEKHDAHLKQDAWLSVERNHRIRHAVEIRHESFVTPDFIDLLRRHGIGFVVADTAGKFPRYFDVTAPPSFMSGCMETRNSMRAATATRRSRPGQTVFGLGGAARSPQATRVSVARRRRAGRLAMCTCTSTTT